MVATILELASLRRDAIGRTLLHLVRLFCWLLLRAIYGLKVAGRIQYLMLVTVRSTFRIAPRPVLLPFVCSDK